MSKLPTELYNMEQIRLLEQLAIDEQGLSVQDLMEHAGAAA